MLDALGARALRRLRGMQYIAAVAWTIVALACNPRHWPRTTRMVFARQVLFTGVEALGFVLAVAFMAGISVVVQIQMQLSKMGQTGLFGPILVTVIARELAPLLVNFIVIGRSGAAIATEMANMRVLGEVRTLDAQGIDPVAYLAMPRALAMVVAVFCLTIFFIVMSLASGFLCGLLMGIGGEELSVAADNILKAVTIKDVYNLLAKTLLPGMITATICFTEGISIKGAITEAPQAATRAVVASVTALFLVSAIVSILTYV